MEIVETRKLKNAKTALEKTDAAFTLGGGASGTGMAIANTISMFAPKGAHLAGKLAGDVAATVIRGLAIGARVAGPIFAVAGVIFGVAGTLIAEAVEHAKMQKLTDSQGKFFKDLADAGVTVLDARISHLAYAPEIAQAMLQRQQANAIIAARTRIVAGAVGMVEMALAELQKNGVVHLDEERKAQMVSNLLVVLCGERATQPIVNAGTLY